MSIGNEPGGLEEYSREENDKLRHNLRTAESSFVEAQNNKEVAGNKYEAAAEGDGNMKYTSSLIDKASSDILTATARMEEARNSFNKHYDLGRDEALSQDQLVSNYSHAKDIFFSFKYDLNEMGENIADTGMPNNAESVSMDQLDEINQKFAELEQMRLELGQLRQKLNKLGIEVD